MQTVGVKEVWALTTVGQNLCVKVNVTMVRLTRFVLMLGCAFGFAAAAPSTTQAGVIPWVYDAIFGPVGSMRGGNSPMYANYGYAGYAPTTVAYAPMSTAYAGSSGCSSCSQSAYYAPSGSYDAYYGSTQAFYGSASYYGNSCCNSCNNSCGSCSGGNCANGNCANGSCSNCSTTTSGYGPSGSLGPVPDPSVSGSRSIEHQLNDLRLRLEEIDHHQKEVDKYLRGNHEGYKPTPYNSRLYDRSETVPARGNRRNESFGSSPTDLEFRGPRRPTAPKSDVIEDEVNKPILSAPGADATSTEKTSDEKDEKSDSTKAKEAEPVTRSLETRVTTRAIAPRQRKQVVSNEPAASVATASKKSVKTPLDSRRVTDLARH